jgi:hypothetical protein
MPQDFMALEYEASRAAREGGCGEFLRRKRAAHPVRGTGFLAALILLALPCAARAAADQVRVMTFNIVPRAENADVGRK